MSVESRQFNNGGAGAVATGKRALFVLSLPAKKWADAVDLSGYELEPLERIRSSSSIEATRKSQVPRLYCCLHLPLLNPRLKR